MTTGRSSGYQDMCRDAPVALAVDGQTYTGLAYLAGRCLTGEATRSVTLRYNPDDPGDFTELAPQRYWIYGFVAVFAVLFLATLVAVLRRIRAHLVRRRTVRSG